MYFTKMQANGNDYVYIDLHRQLLPDPARSAVRLSHRHFGVGGDGLVLLCPSAHADFRMRIFDPDGTEAEMCGNALMSAGALFALSGHTRKTRLTVETLAGDRQVFLTRDEGDIREVSAEIGAPRVRFDRREETVCGRRLLLTSLSFGNPHCVVFTKDLSDETFFTLGPALECHPLFPERTNVEFLCIEAPDRMRMRTWERGCGETLSCATGSAAGVVAATLAEKSEGDAVVIQRGGSIRARWERERDSVRIFGRTRVVFTGSLPESSLSSSLPGTEAEEKLPDPSI